jgi:hypothetical protein
MRREFFFFFFWLCVCVCFWRVYVRGGGGGGGGRGGVLPFSCILHAAYYIKDSVPCARIKKQKQSHLSHGGVAGCAQTKI